MVNHNTATLAWKSLWSTVYGLPVAISEEDTSAYAFTGRTFLDILNMYWNFNPRDLGIVPGIRKTNAILVILELFGWFLYNLLKASAMMKRTAAMFTKSWK